MPHHAAKKLLIGAHCSAAGGAYKALYEGQELGATTIQLFTSNQKQWKGKEITKEDIDLWVEAKEKTGIKVTMSHSSYLINLGSPKQESIEKSLQAFSQEMNRCHKLQIDYLNFHPGAATGSSEEECLDQIAKSLNTLAKQCDNGKTKLLLETTAGQGTSVGHTFEHLRYIIQNVNIPIGVCIDTCHIFAAGYDIRSKKAFDKTFKEFDQIVGLKHLKAFHLNDSKHPLGSKKDRHAHLGEGEIGIKGFELIMKHPKLQKLPKYLETPKEPTKWMSEIALLRKFGT